MTGGSRRPHGIDECRLGDCERLTAIVLDRDDVFIPQGITLPRTRTVVRDEHVQFSIEPPRIKPDIEWSRCRGIRSRAPIAVGHAAGAQKSAGDEAGDDAWSRTKCREFGQGHCHLLTRLDQVVCWARR